MLLLIIFLTCIFVALGAGALSGLSDIRGMTIPNLYSLVVIAAFFAAYICLYIGGRGEVFSPLSAHLLSALLTFSLTALLFGGRMIGAADSKLATAYAFWLGIGDVPVFLAYMVFAGGVLAVASLVFMRLKPFKSPDKESWIGRVQNGESKVPYGVAIAFGALVAFFKVGYMDSDVLVSFLHV